MTCTDCSTVYVIHSGAGFVYDFQQFNGKIQLVDQSATLMLLPFLELRHYD